MKKLSQINNEKALEWGLNIQQAYLFSWIFELVKQDNGINIHGKIYHFSPKQKVIKELPLLTDKIDTVYRHYKSLEELGLIIIEKIGNADYLMITDKAKSWESIS